MMIDREYHARGDGNLTDDADDKVTFDDARGAELALVETDDTSLAVAWIATEGGSYRGRAEIVHASDGTLRVFDRETGLWEVSVAAVVRRRLSAFLCDVADAKLCEADVKLTEGGIDTKAHMAVAALRKNLRSQARLKAVWQTAHDHLEIVAIDDFDAEPYMLGTPDGVIDLRTGDTRPATAGDMVSKLTAVVPAPAGTPAPQWMKFISEAFEGNAETLEFIQRLFGSALVGDVSPQKFFVLYGRGANGKSVLRDVMGRLAGSYAGTGSAKVFMQTHGDRHPTEIASLAGKRLVLASEVPAGRSWDGSLIKDLTGGEKVTARRMHKDEFSFTPCGTLVFTANTLPSFTGADEAMLRRIVLLTFPRQFSESEQKPNLADILIREDGPAILRWAVDGARKFLAEGGGAKGLRIPRAVTDAGRAYFEDEDRVFQFLTDAQCSAASAIDWSPGAFIGCGELLDEFNRWAERNGHKKWSVRSLTKAVRESSERYGMQDARTKTARGFQVERLLGAPGAGQKDAGGKCAQKAVIRHLRAVKNRS